MRAEISFVRLAVVFPEPRALLDALIDRLWKFVKRVVLYVRLYVNFTELRRAIDGCLDDIPTKHRTHSPHPLAALMTTISRTPRNKDRQRSNPRENRRLPQAQCDSGVHGYFLRPIFGDDCSCDCC